MEMFRGFLQTSMREWLSSLDIRGWTAFAYGKNCLCSCLQSCLITKSSAFQQLQSLYFNKWPYLQKWWKSLTFWVFLVGKGHRELSALQNQSLHVLNFLPGTLSQERNKMPWYSDCNLPGLSMGRKSSTKFVLAPICPFKFMQIIQDHIFL